MKIYIGGDSGYDSHYKAIAEKHQYFDLAILDNGQYDKAWQYIHHLPEEVLQVAQEIHAKQLFPVHSCKFVMANHSWDEPLERITELNTLYNIPLMTPRIGEIVPLAMTKQVFTQWWKDSEL
jgi:L-ascorbate metabolism protein UlaG (beta-lactamase superfamily)